MKWEIAVAEPEGRTSLAAQAFLEPIRRRFP